jgi:hypothetical protein
MSAGKVFGVWSLGIFTFSFLANVNTTPELAQFGLGSIAIIALAILLFLAPTAMASAELGGTWPHRRHLRVDVGGVRWRTEPVAPEPAGERIGEPEPEPV